MWIIIFLVMAVSFFIIPGILFWVSKKMFKIETTYKKSLLIWFFSAVIGSIISFVFRIVNLGSVSNILLWIVSIFVFYFLFKKYYQCSFKTALLVYIVFSLISGVVMGLFVVTVRASIFTPFVNKGISMSPTYNDGDYLLINKVDKNFMRDDIVVLSLANNSFLIKRIVGLPLEKVEIKDGKVYINNQILNDGKETKGSVSIKLELNQYFVLTDNRAGGIDSRNFGPIYKNDIVGKVFFKLSN